MRIKRPKLRKKLTGSTEKSGSKKDELRNFYEQIKSGNLERLFDGLHPSLLFPTKTFHCATVFWMNSFKNVTALYVF